MKESARNATEVLPPLLRLMAGNLNGHSLQTLSI